MTDRCFARPVLKTARLCLRRPAARDVDAIVAAVGNRDVARRLSRIPHPYGPDDARFFLEAVVPGEWVWAITQSDADRLLGVVGLTPEGETAELGYWLGMDAWGRGLATEAARAVIAHGFEVLGLPYILSGYFADNAASGGVLRKLGFVETGRASRPCLMLGQDVPSVEMRLARAG